MAAGGGQRPHGLFRRARAPVPCPLRRRHGGRPRGGRGPRQPRGRGSRRPRHAGARARGATGLAPVRHPRSGPGAAGRAARAAGAAVAARGPGGVPRVPRRPHEAHVRQGAAGAGASAGADPPGAAAADLHRAAEDEEAVRLPVLLRTAPRGRQGGDRGGAPRHAGGREEPGPLPCLFELARAPRRRRGLVKRGEERPSAMHDRAGHHDKVREHVGRAGRRREATLRRRRTPRRGQAAEAAQAGHLPQTRQAD